MDYTTVAVWILGIVFNIGVVGQIRAKAQDAGRQFLQSGRFAVAAVFVLCLLQQFFLGGCSALDSPQALVDLVNQSWVMAGACVGTHASFKTIIRRGH